MKTTSAMMSEADDLIFEFRNLSGTGDLDQAVEVIKRMHDLVQAATGFDRANESDDSTLALSYILDQQEILIGNLPGIPKGNRSRTAAIAAASRYRNAAA